jgi:AcrR family transcriptional regulator
LRTLDEVKFNEKRMEILAAARQCFGRKGFRGASISDICTAAGISPGHLYHYFAGKEAIVEALVDAETAQAVLFFAKLADHESIVDALVMRLGARTKAGRAGEPSITIEMLAESSRNKAVAAIINRRDRARRELLAELLRNGQKRGQVDRGLDPDVAAGILSRLMELPGLQAIHDPAFDMEAGVKLLQALLRSLLEPPSVHQRRRRRISRPKDPEPG